MDGFTIGLVVMLVVCAAGAAFIWGPGWLQDRQARRLAVEGMPAAARILAIEDTGARFNGVPQMRLRLEVMPPGRAPYPAELLRVMPGPVAPLVPGATIAVRVDPAHPGRVALAP